MQDLRSEEQEILARFGFEEAEFAALRERFRRGELAEQANIETGRIEPPPAECLEDLPDVESDAWRRLEEIGREAIRAGKLALVILNGGMATRFGGVVKGVVPVTGDVSFLQLKMQHTAAVARACGGRIPMLLMNSWATERATEEHLAGRDYFGLDRAELFAFSQYLHPRLTAAGEIFRGDDGAASFYGPGHGDFPIAFRRKGGLAWLRERGVEHVLVANVDNLGARVEPAVLGFHLDRRVEATVEVAPKWPGDLGGCPVLVDGRLQVLEGFRFPREFDQDQVEVFNCNTFTFRLDALDQEFPLSWFLVRKRVGKEEVIQFERLVGQVTARLECAYLVVPRTGRCNRFYPVKTPRDLEEGKAVIGLLYPDLGAAESGGA